MIALIAGLLAEVGARTQQTCLNLGQYGAIQRRSILLLLTILITSIAISATGGVLVATLLNANAGLMLLGLALAFAGAGQLRRIAPGAAAGEPPTAMASVMRLGAAHIADGTPFIAFAVAARSQQMLLTSLGSMVAVLALCLPAILMRTEWDRSWLFDRLRRVAAALLLISGIWCVLIALRLI